MLAFTNAMSFENLSPRWFVAVILAGVAIACMVPVFRHQPDGHRYRKLSHRVAAWTTSSVVAMVAWLVLFGSVSFDGADALRSTQSWQGWIMVISTIVIMVLPVAVFVIGIVVLVEWRTVPPPQSSRRRRRALNRLTVIDREESPT